MNRKVMVPKVSVIIPSFNIEQYLPRCIESVLSQTFTDFELLLLDDGSIDGTPNVCNEYRTKDSRVKVFSHPNKGVSYTRNRGICEALGEFIMFIDGDDYIKKDYIEELFRAYEEGNWPICGMINVRNNQAKKNESFAQLLQRYPTGIIERDNFLDLLKYNSFSSPCVRIYSKSILTQNRIFFNEEFTYQEDVLFNMEYSKHMKRASIIDYFGYFYIEHKSSSTSRFHSNFDHIGLLMDNLKKMVRRRTDENIVKEFIFDTILRKIANLYHSNSKLNKQQKLLDLKKIFLSESFLYTEDYIKKSRINFVLKYLLMNKYAYLVNLYYTKLHS